jgi:two-component system phosphate regulon sensor histidine kinase PhoR
MKLSYRQRLFLYFGLLFTLFTVGIIVYEQVREKTYKTQGLQEKLETYTDIIQAAIVDAQDSVAPAINQLQNLLPEDLRITIINKEGKVLFDNSINDYVRPSLIQKKRSKIRFKWLSSFTPIPVS